MPSSSLVFSTVAVAFSFAAPLFAAQLPHEAATKPVTAPTAPAPVTPAIDPENIWYLDLSTGGRVTILLRPSIAPQHVERIKTLSRRGFYNGLTFHRVIEGFMAQGGDPEGTGQGGSDLPPVKAEFNDAPHVRGAVAMARASEPDSANSQFYIMLQPMLRLDRNYTVFGRVIAGMQYVDALERGEPPANPSRILQASIAADNKPMPVFPPPAPKVDPLAAEAAKLSAEPPAATPAPAATPTKPRSKPASNRRRR